MRTILRPKHQVLVLKCYPQTKNLSDPKPNPSELSYLLYYASSRRSKLQKVGEFLEKKTARDVWRGRYGNVQVTLDICEAIIEKCPKDLSLFAPSILTVLSDVLQAKDISLTDYSLKCFRSFCAHHDGTVLATDHEYLSKFESVIKAYAACSTTPQPSLGLRWRSIALQAVKAIASSDALSASDGQRQLEIIVPVIVQNIYHESVQHLHNLRDMSEVAEDDEVRRLRMSLTIVPTNTTAQDGTTPGGIAAATASTAEAVDRVEEEDIGVSALLSLKKLFETNSVPQIRCSTAAVLKCIVDKSVKGGEGRVSEQWATGLLEMIATWAPVQHRYTILITCQDKLTTTGMDDAVLPTQLLLAKIISCLLSSKVNLIGLSVMDVLLGFISHIFQLLRLETSTKSSRGNSRDGNAGSVDEGSMTASAARKELLRKLEKCIGDLATHIYYSDQISDMVQEILAHLKAKSGSAPDTGAFDAEKSKEEFFSHNTASVSGLRAIKQIFMVANVHNSTSGVGRNKVPIRVWEGSQWLLKEKDRLVRHAYVDAFVTWLDVEIGNGQDAVKEDGASFQLPEIGQMSPRIRRMSGPPAWQPAQPIESVTIFSSAFLKLLLVALYENAIKYANASAEVMNFHLILTKIVSNLGFSAAMVALPMLFKLEDEGFQLENTTSKIHLCSLSLEFYHTVANHFRLEEAKAGLEREIESRKARGQWFHGIVSPPTELARIGDGQQNARENNIESSPVGVSEHRGLLLDECLQYAENSGTSCALPLPKLKDLLTATWTPESVQSSLSQTSTQNPSSLADSRLSRINHHQHQGQQHQGQLDKFQSPFVAPARIPHHNTQIPKTSSSSPQSSSSTSTSSNVVRVEDLKRVLKGAPLTSSGRYSDLSTSASGESVVSVVSVGSELVSSDDEAHAVPATGSSPRRSNTTTTTTSRNRANISPAQTHTSSTPSKKASSRANSIRRPRSATNRDNRPPFVPATEEGVNATVPPIPPIVMPFGFDLPGSFPTDAANAPVISSRPKTATESATTLTTHPSRTLKSSTSDDGGLHKTATRGTLTPSAVAGSQRAGRLSVLELLDGLQAEKRSRGARGGERPKSSWGEGGSARVRPPY